MNGNYDSENNFNINGDNKSNENRNNNSEKDNKYSSDFSYIEQDLIFSEKSHQDRKNSDYEEDLKNEKRFSTVSLVLGLYTIASLFMCCGFGNIITGIISIVYARKAKNTNHKKLMNANASAGLICSIIGICLTVLAYLFIVVIGLLTYEAESSENLNLLLSHMLKA